MGSHLHPHDADHNANSPYSVIGTAADRLAQQDRERELREAEKRALEEKTASYPPSVVYVGSLSGLLGFGRWVEGKTKAVVVDMGTIDFSNAINADKLARDKSGTLFRTLKELQDSTARVKENLLIRDVGLQLPLFKYDLLTGYGKSIDQHVAYGHLGVNLEGRLEIDKKSKKWRYSAFVTPNGRMGYYNNRIDLPILDRFDPNPYSGQDKRYLGEKIFKAFRDYELSQPNELSYFVIAKTQRRIDGTVGHSPGYVTLEGDIP